MDLGSILAGVRGFKSPPSHGDTRFHFPPFPFTKKGSCRIFFFQSMDTKSWSPYRRGRCGLKVYRQRITLRSPGYREYWNGREGAFTVRSRFRTDRGCSRLHNNSSRWLPGPRRGVQKRGPRAHHPRMNIQVFPSGGGPCIRSSRG